MLIKLEKQSKVLSNNYDWLSLRVIMLMINIKPLHNSFIFKPILSLYNTNKLRNNSNEVQKLAAVTYSIYSLIMMSKFGFVYRYSFEAKISNL